MAFDVNELSSVINGNAGLLRPAHFFTFITAPNWALQEDNSAGENRIHPFLCYSANIPDLTVSSNNFRPQGIGVLQKRANDVSFGNLTLNFFCDGRGLVLKYFQKWIQNIQNINGNMSYDNQYNKMKVFEFGYPENYETNLDIYVLNSAGDEVLQTTIINAYPSAIKTIPLDWGSTNEIITIAVDFNYNYFFTDAFDMGTTAATNSTSFLTFFELLYVDKKVAAAYAFNNVVRSSQIANIVNTVDNFVVPLLRI